MLLDKNPDWTVLVGNYNYTANGCYRTSLNENEIKIFLNILLSPNKFSIGRAISLTQYILKEKNAENIPTEVTFRRYAKWYKANNLDKWTLARDGMKALKDKVEPYIVRVNHNSMQNFVHLHLAEQIFRFHHNYDEVNEEITRFI